MKKLFFIFVFLFSFGLIFSQHKCYLENINSNLQSSIINGITFYSEETCDPLVLNVNFVFFRRDDGSGTFQENSPEVNNLITEINNKLASVKNNGNCYSGQYPVDSKIRLDVNVDYIDDSSLFDWYQKAIDLGTSYYETAFCPGSIPNNWPEIYDEIDSYNTSNPNSFNIFFVENNDLLTHIENAIDNGETDSNHTPWVDQNNIDIFSGCSSLANSYNSTNDEWVLQINFYTEHQLRKNYGNTYYGPILSNPHTNEEILSWEVDDYESLIIHEMGHSIMDQGHTCGCNNIMIGAGCNPSYVGNTQSLSYDQLENLHRTLSSSNNHKYVNCKNLSESSCNFHVTQNSTISQPMSVWGDLIVEENVTLTITSQVYLSKYSEIVVNRNGKLIVDGGLLTSGCDETWRGIKTRKNDNGYAVEIINNSTIENTSQAAVSMFASGGWLLGDGDAEVKIENSTFNNCRRMLAMGASSSSLNNSIISNNTQNGGKWGITNWNCRGVQVRDNVFNNITNECIVTEHGQFTIERNTFNSGRADILFANTNPGFGTWILSNTFNGRNTGIRALGASLGQHWIKENQFFTGEFDAFMDGDNNYLIEDNDFTSDFALTSINNGLHSNDVWRNNITGNFIGLLPLGDNANYLFYDNCFNTSFTDSWIEGQINDPQAHGQNLGAANNCFTHGGSANHPTSDIDGSPNHFTYNEPDDDVLDCRDAIKAEANGFIDIDDSNGEVDSPCGSVGSGIGPIPPSTQFNPCNPPKDITITWDAISWLENKLQQIELDPNLTDEQKDYYSDIYERCLQRVKWQWVQLVIEDERYEDARNYLATDRSNDAILAIYATYISENDLNGARQYLKGINSNDEAVLDFITIQMINLDRLANGRVFTPTSKQLQFVETIANKKHPYAGYAKALYYWLTSEILVSDMPDFDGRGFNTRSAKSDKINSKIYPNPFQNQLTIEIESGQDLKLEITDLFGKVYASRNIDKSTIVNSSTWNNGVYIVSLWSEGKVIKQEKVVLTR